MRAGVSAEIGRCEREISAIEDALLAGHSDVTGLCLALSDWERGASHPASGGCA